MSRAELDLIAGLCVECNVVAVSDEIHKHIVYDSHEHVILTSLPGMADRSTTTRELGKTYAAAGC